MKKAKTKIELTDIAKKAWVTRLKNLKKFKFKNTNGENKNSIRELKANAYAKSGVKDGNILLLPSQTCSDVYTINKIIPDNRYNFIGAEINKHAIVDINTKILRDQLSMIVYPHPVGSLVKASTKNQYSHIDLDLCGTFSKNYKTLGDVLSKDIVKPNGIISATFSTRDVNIKAVSNKILGKVGVRKELSKSNPCLLKPTITKYIKDNSSGRYKIISKPRIYTDKGLGGYMCFVMIQRIK